MTSPAGVCIAPSCASRPASHRSLCRPPHPPLQFAYLRFALVLDPSDCPMPSITDSAGDTNPSGTGAPPRNLPTSYRDSAPPILALLLAFRLTNALALHTFFQPDEFFQSLEPAWQLAFGDASNAWITWVNFRPLPPSSFHPPLTITPTIPLRTYMIYTYTLCTYSAAVSPYEQEWTSRLRSSLHPALFAAVYRVVAHVAQASGLSLPAKAEILLVAPKVTQAVSAALLDCYTWKLAGKVYGRGSRTALAAVRQCSCNLQAPQLLFALF